MRVEIVRISRAVRICLQMANAPLLILAPPISLYAAHAHAQDAEGGEDNEQGDHSNADIAPSYNTSAPTNEELIERNNGTVPSERDDTPSFVIHDGDESRIGLGGDFSLGAHGNSDPGDPGASVNIQYGQHGGHSGSGG